MLVLFLCFVCLCCLKVYCIPLFYYTHGGISFLFVLKKRCQNPFCLFSSRDLSIFFVFFSERDANLFLFVLNKGVPTSVLFVLKKGCQYLVLFSRRNANNTFLSVLKKECQYLFTVSKLISASRMKMRCI